MISAVIITYNEEKNLARCLDSIKEVCDEIIIVDSFSSDRTKEIAESFSNVIYYEREFTSHGDQKNFGNAKANNPYILSLDADEELSEEINCFFTENKANLTYDAYSFRRLNYLGNKPIKHGLWYPDEKIRLFKKDVAFWQVDVLHEELNLKIESSVCKLSYHILHWAFDNIDQLNTKGKIYAEWWAKYKHKSGKKSTNTTAILHAIWTFIRAFFIKLAFLDGTIGILIAIENSKGAYLKYKQLYLLSKND